MTNHRTTVDVAGSAAVPGNFVVRCCCGWPDRRFRREYDTWDSADAAGREHAGEAADA